MSAEPRTLRTEVRSQSPHYVYLDILRFAAAVSVMLYHYSTANHVAEYWQVGTKAAIGTSAADYRSLMPYFSYGWVGVDIFFVISGFVIALSAEGRGVKSFVQSRILRLYPVIVIGTITAFVVSLLYSQMSWQNILFLSIKQLVLFPKGHWIDGVFWTLIVEISFYAVIAVTIYIGQYRNLEKIAALWCGLTSVAALVVLLAHLSGNPDLEEVYRFGVSYAARILLISTGPYFVFGIMIYLVARDGITAGRMLLLAGSFGAGLVNVYLATTDEEFFRAGYTEIYVPMAVWAIAVSGIAIAAWSGRPFPGGARVRVIARWAGLMTFPLYLIHNSLGAFLLGLLIKGGMPIYPAFWAASILVIAVSFFIARSVEPVLRSVIKLYIFPRVEKLRLRAAFH